MARRDPPPFRPHEGDALLPAWRLGLRYAFEGNLPARSLRVALVVGAILNLINQGDALWRGGDGINWWKFLLTFAVPYAVSTYGAVSFRLSLRHQ